MSTGARCIGFVLLGTVVMPPVALAQSGQPEWSPQGDWIAFESTRDGNSEIYRIRPDGSDQQNLSHDPSDDRHPGWTPDGQWLIFDSDRSGDREIYLMRPDGSAVHRLTASAGDDVSARISPAGDRIAFNSRREGNWDVYVMDFDGSNPVNVTRHPAVDIVRSWSADGLIQFDSDRPPNEDGNRDGYLVRPDGTALTRLTDDAYDNRFLRRGPPGTSRVALTSNRSGTRGIYTVDRDGSDLRVVYDGPGQDQFPTWSPDSRFVAFASDESGTSQIYRLTLQTSAVRALTRANDQEGAGQAPRCPDAEGFHALDFWIGEWTVWSGGTQVGTNRIVKVQNGCAIEEHWVDAEGGTGQSLFYYLPAEDSWRQVWVTPNARLAGGVKEKRQVESPAGTLRFQGTITRPNGDTYLDRTTLTPLEGGRVRQVIEISTDSGVTWTAGFDAEYRPARSDR